MNSRSHLKKLLCRRNTWGWRVVAFCALLVLACDSGEPETNFAVHLAKFPNNRDAGLTLTFDDGCPSVFTHIAPLLDANDLKATFFIIAGHVEHRNEWQRWIDLRSRGHEIGNHSLTHSKYLGTLDDREILELEIDSSYRLMKSRMQRGPFSFGHPFHSTNALADEIVFKNHFVSKITPFGFCRLIPLYDMDVFTKELDEAMTSNKWLVTTAHGVNDCPNPLSSEFFVAFIEHVVARRVSLHVDTYENLARYKIELAGTKVKVQQQGPDFRVFLESELPEEFTFPLTVLVDGLDTNEFDIVGVEPSMVSVTDSNHFQVNAAPHSTFLIKKR
jgi:peptidoglycan-N-acetylglucosamine deacetylase